MKYRLPARVAMTMMTAALLALSACGGGGGDSGPTTTASAALGATIASTTGSPAMTGDPVALVGQASAGRSPYRYAWDFGDGTKLDNGNATATHPYATAGDFTATLAVTDADGVTARATTTVRVESRTDLSVVPRPGMEASVGQTIWLYPSDRITRPATRYDWDLGGGRTATGDEVSLVVPAKGQYPVKVTATYPNGQRTASAVINVERDAPWLTITPPSVIRAGKLMSFVMATNAAPAIQSATWDFGDGTPKQMWAGGANHIYAQAGTYEVSVYLVNSTGAYVTTKVTVTVIAAPDA